MAEYCLAAALQSQTRELNARLKQELVVRITEKGKHKVATA